MRVTGVPNCCATAIVTSDVEYDKALEIASQAYKSGAVTLGGNYYKTEAGLSRWGVIEGPIPLSLIEKQLKDYGYANSGGNKESSVALASAIYNSTPESIEREVQALSAHNYPTLVIAIARWEFLTTAMKKDGWQAVLQWPAAHGGADLILFAKPRVNAGKQGGKMTILQPQEPPSKDAKKAGEQLQEIAKEQLQKAVAAAKMPDPVAEVKIDYWGEPKAEHKAFGGGWAPIPDLMYANQQNALYGGAQPAIPIPPPVQKWTPVMEARVRRLRKRAEKPPTQEVITRARRIRARRIAP